MGRFFDNESFDQEGILEPHVGRTLERMSQHPIVLVPQDTSHLNFSSHKATKGLGHIGTAHGLDHQGIMMHSALAISPQGECLGLLHQKQWTRPEKLRKSAKNAHQSRPFSQKESFKWVETLRAVDNLIQGLEHRPKLVWLGDREADIYEHLAEHVELGHDFIIRVNCNRVVDDDARFLMSVLSEQSPAGSYEMSLRDEDGKSHQAKIEVRFGVLQLLGQRRKGGAFEGKLPNLKVYGVLAREVDPPAGYEPIEWCLITSLPVNTFEEATQVIGYYEKRWHIECFHKALKSGLRAEACRLDRSDKLMKFIALASIIATRLYWASMLRRHNPEASCSQLLTELEWRVLGLNATGKPLTEPPTVKQATTWIAELGGFRHTYKEPGMIVYWRGWRELLRLVAGARLGSRLLSGKDVSYC